MVDSAHSIPLFAHIEEYNSQIGITPPRYPDFDIRDFAENMKSVRLKMPPFRIPFFQFALLESGGGTVSSDGQAYKLSQFTLFFNLPGQIIYWDVPQDWKGYYISLNESFYTVQLDEFKRLYDFPFFKNFSPGIQLQADEATLILELMQRIHQEYQHPSTYNMPIIKSYVGTILSYATRFYERQKQDNARNDQQLSLGDRFKNLVNQHIRTLALGINDTPLSVSDCAQQLFVTPKYLSEAVKKDLGLTPTQYINQNLVQEAQKLLRATQMQVKEIAYQLGFHDVSYFNRLFKKVCKQSPAQYRKDAIR